MNEYINEIYIQAGVTLFGLRSPGLLILVGVSRCAAKLAQHGRRAHVYI